MFTRGRMSLSFFVLAVSEEQNRWVGSGRSDGGVSGKAGREAKVHF